MRPQVTGFHFVNAFVHSKLTFLLTNRPGLIIIAFAALFLEFYVAFTHMRRVFNLFHLQKETGCYLL